MTLFDVLRCHVADRPDAIAVQTPYRSASYRKMWSRIERSTARLQGEWQIVPGDTIVYFGCGHLDALVMYYAAARCGARVLPLEHAHLQVQAAEFIAATGAALLLHDDGIDPIDCSFGVPTRVLSSLIATVCQHRESGQEDSTRASLLEPGPDAPVVRTHRTDELLAAASAAPSGPARVRGALFDREVFAPVVLATMLHGATLTLE